MTNLQSETGTNFRQENPEVYYAPPGFVTISDTEIDWLIERASKLPRKRSRLCFHQGPSSLVHDMLIIHHQSCYVRPHRHFTREETLTVLRGKASTLLFSERGDLEKRVALGSVGHGRVNIHRMPPGLFHVLVIESEWLVFLETTAGPFDPKGSEFAPWSPDGKDVETANYFTEELRRHMMGR